ncbi:hypothetical protein A2U01_0060126 [Trifolium medium]|uniref:Uncharacterized protein n=1 Tax=Trifolium medium TaxID=97028 RepID=A0A392RRV1_9FABA|nr:hypothetical protein [Trifolium medium]
MISSSLAPDSPEWISNIFFKRSFRSGPYLQSFLRMTSTRLYSAPLSSYSSQVHPLRTAASEEFRDTRRPNPTNALGFN